MIALNKRELCYEAEAYLYDCVSEDYQADIPPEIAAHMIQCPYCQREMNLLKQTVDGLDMGDQTNLLQAHEETTTCLKMHFRFLGQEVDCYAIKPFLPLFNAPSYQVRVPTPVTVHLNHCSQCRKNCNAIGELELTDSQLLFFSQLLADKICLDPDTLNSVTDLVTLLYEDSLENAHDLQKLQRIRQTISSTVNRKNSGVVTIYEMCEDTDLSTSNRAGDLYADWPISVQVMDEDQAQGESPETIKAATTSPGVSKSSVSRFSRSFIRRAVKPLAAAAVLLLAFSLFFNNSVEALEMDQIYNALSKVDHLYIGSFASQKTEPEQEIWASRPLDITLINTKGHWMLWDLSNKVNKERRADSLSHATLPLNKRAVVILSRYSSSFGSLMPFANIDDLPADSAWRQIDDPAITAELPGTEVFELDYVRKIGNGEILPQKWRCYLDPQKHLPLRTELYEKIQIQGEDKFVKKSTRQIRYLQKKEIQAVLESAFPQ